WNNISEEAQDFVRQLLENDPDRRMTSKTAIKHRWMDMEEESLALNDLGTKQEDMMLRNAKQKMKNAVHLFLLTGRYCGALERTDQKSEFLRAYDLCDKLGKGSFANVFRATRKSTHKCDLPQDVAVKQTARRRPSRSETENCTEKVLSEVCILGRLKHENVIKMHEFFHDDPEHFYIVLELMRGGELFEQIPKRTGFNEQEARDACRVLLKALKYIHSRG
ncbi:unnamed protein product, partial [Ascophyllum nodosum]